MSSARIAILDYGMGNLRSVEKALEHVGAVATITNDAATVRAADGVILPGVGAFPRAMERIRERGLDELIAERRDAGVPILGICLGLQLLFDSTTELGGADGLGLLAGPVTALAAGGLKVPHIGWTPVSWERESRLTDGIASGTPFYFVHSFVARPEPGELLGTAEYGERVLPAWPSAATSSASSSTRRSRAPPGCGCSPTSPASAPPCQPRRAGVILYPAIDIRGGQAVRLLQGDYDHETVYDADPVDAAKRWAGEGAEFLHVVDLDGAKAGEPQNLEVGARGSPPRSSARSRSAADCATPASVAALLGRRRGPGGDRHRGAARPGVPRRDRDRARASGWSSRSTRAGARSRSPAGPRQRGGRGRGGRRLGGRGVGRFLFTPIEVDGTMAGPAVDELRADRRGDRRPVIASGGVGELAHLEQLAELGARPRTSKA